MPKTVGSRFVDVDGAKLGLTLSASRRVVSPVSTSIMRRRNCGRTSCASVRCCAATHKRHASVMRYHTCRHWACIGWVMGVHYGRVCMHLGTHTKCAWTHIRASTHVSQLGVQAQHVDAQALPRTHYGRTVVASGCGWESACKGNFRRKLGLFSGCPDLPTLVCVRPCMGMGR